MPSKPFLFPFPYLRVKAFGKKMIGASAAPGPSRPFSFNGLTRDLPLTDSWLN